MSITKSATSKSKKKQSKLVSIKVHEPKIVCVEFGCGQSKVTPEVIEQQMQIKVEKVIGVDWAELPGVDKIHDLTEFPYPFKDNSVDAIYASHFAEHLDGYQRRDFMCECYRILKPGGKMRLIHPYYKSVRAVQDFSHKWPPISENSYLYWDKNWMEANKLTHGDYAYAGKGECDFAFNIYYTWQDAAWATKSEEQRNFAVNHYFNVVADMIVDLTKRVPA